MPGPAVHAVQLSVDDAEAELRGDDDVLPPSREGLSQELLVAVGPVRLGRVEERDAEVERAVDRGDRLVLVGIAVGLAHSHAAQPESRDLEALLSEPALGEFRHCGLKSTARSFSVAARGVSRSNRGRKLAPREPERSEGDVRPERGPEESPWERPATEAAAGSALGSRCGGGGRTTPPSGRRAGP